MPLEARGKEGPKKRVWLRGVFVGVVAAIIVVLASGYMVELTNTDTFCVSCHIMKPFRTAWLDSVHGGQNKQGFRAQCVDCHLPHGDFVEYLTTKAITGTNDVIHNMYIDAYSYDWAGNAEKHRQKFTYDSACRRCHANLTPQGLSSGGLRAHRTYLLGETDKHCSNCHEHVGHKDMIIHVVEYFGKNK